MEQIKLKLTVDQVNTILAALGEMPFSKVYDIIQTIQEQASSQMNGEEETNQEKEA